MTFSHDLLVFGASGKTGLHVVRLARAAGLRVAALLRPGRDAEALERLDCTVLRGDALNASDCAAAFAAAQPATAVSLLGGRNEKGERVDATGNLHVIDAAQAWQADLRFVLLTSMGCDEQFAGMPEQVQQLLGEALRAKTQAERHLRASTLTWTILRPGGLNDMPAVGGYLLSDYPTAESRNYLSREDVAQAVLDALGDRTRAGRAQTVSARPAA
ncbi:MAG: NAD(P)H-binding protein [Candidatus Dactylopiibacterium sp.]|nr:NAD(P)H-binding protein [Candidatus Dactylopiibacterium sp.]